MKVCRVPAAPVCALSSFAQAIRGGCLGRFHQGAALNWVRQTRCKGAARLSIDADQRRRIAVFSS